MSSLDDVIQSSRRDFVAQLPQRLADIHTRWNARSIRELYHAVHNLFGTSAVLGLDELSRGAQVLDGTLGSIWRDGGTVTAEQEKQIAEQITALTDIAQRPLNR